MLPWFFHVFLITHVKTSQQTFDRILLWIVWTIGRVQNFRVVSTCYNSYMLILIFTISCNKDHGHLLIKTVQHSYIMNLYSYYLEYIMSMLLMGFLILHVLVMLSRWFFFWIFCRHELHIMSASNRIIEGNVQGDLYFIDFSTISSIPLGKPDIHGAKF